MLARAADRGCRLARMAMCQGGVEPCLAVGCLLWSRGPLFFTFTNLPRPCPLQAEEADILPYLERVADPALKHSLRWAPARVAGGLTGRRREPAGRSLLPA